MKLIKTLALLLMSGMLLTSCQKEYSEENGGGGGVATGTLKSAASGECLPSSVHGNFIAGTALTTAHYINVDVDITTAGAYTITTDVVNGYSFSASGIATATGVQTIKLVASGTPTAAGANTFTVKFGTSQCNIVVEVYPAGTGNATLTVDCTGAVPAGTYTQGTAMTSANTVTVQVTVTAAGFYNITTNTANAVSFSGTGFLAVGTHPVVLSASGTPTASGLNTYTVTAGTSTCDFDVTYAVSTTPPVGGLTWSFKVGSTTYSGTTDVADLDQTAPATLLITGENTTAGSTFSLALSNTSGTITTGDYVGTLTPGKITATFDFNQGAIDYVFFPSMGNITTKLTTLNMTTRIVEGTFSGTAKEGATGTGPNVTITEGKFKASLP